MDDPLLSTLASDTIQEETDDSMEPNPKDGSVVLAQLATNALVTSLVSSTEPMNVEDLVIREKTDGNSLNLPAS